VFDYQALDPVTLKGKAEPVPVFAALAPRARLGTDVTRTLSTPLVGRQIDLGILTGAFQKAVQESAVQLVVVAGEPGVGKSRLVAELLSFAEAWPGELVRWRQGRCLPYGEGITFWSLGEIVKAEAGILETDSPETASAKIDAVIPDDAPDAPWLRARLRPLAGLPAPEAGREENFAAWRAFLELLADDAPTVLVVEDLHWADPALLDFLEHLTEQAEGVPLLLVTTARPELFEKAPTWAASARNLAKVNLSPLAQAETARLIGNLLGSAVLPAEVQQAILDRAGGNPLYAEQFVRLLQDQNILTRAGAGWRLDPGAEIPLPPGVHGLIAARPPAPRRPGRPNPPSPTR
jgi:predicted ATPase